MAYTKELIDEVKELYPTSTQMIELAENGSVWLGRYLDDSSPTGIPLNRILLATSLEDLQKEARLSKRKIELYKKWCEQDPRKNR
jgi:hypothetical protein